MSQKIKYNGQVYNAEYDDNSNEWEFFSPIGLLIAPETESVLYRALMSRLVARLESAYE